MGYTKRTFLIEDSFLSCINCQLNYNASNPDEKTYCQEFGHAIDPENKHDNQVRAHDCGYWVPESVPRDKVHTDSPEHIRWYEKDSLG